jgi:hypothetical protein
MLVGYQHSSSKYSLIDPSKQDTSIRTEDLSDMELTCLEGCRETKAPFLGEGVLSYTVPKQEKLFIRSGLALSAHCRQESSDRLGLTILRMCR